MPNTAAILVNRGLTYSRLERYEKALEDLNEAIKLYPNQVDIWMQTGQIWSKKRNYVKALECFEKALEIDPNNEEAQNSKEKTLKRIR